MIEKLPITLTANTNTKVYDGTISATATPTLTLGSLASGDVGTYSETYDTKNQGTNKTLTPSGTIVDASNTSMTGNYSITYASVNTGVIEKLPITLTANTNTKVYDGTLSSTTTPTLTGTLASGDVGVYSQSYDTKSQGTNKVLTPTATILDASNALMTGNYSITYATNTNGVITAKQLTILDPMITKNKEYDKTVTANTTEGTLSGVITVGSVADAVTSSAVGTYSTSTVGTNKTITVVYTLDGADKDNYIKPVDKVYTDGVINAKQLTISDPTITKNKEYDKTLTASITAGTLSGVITLGSVADAVTASAVGTYSSSSAGKAKTITVVYTLAGADKDNYIKPVDKVYTDGVITAKQLTISDPTITKSKEYDKTITANVTAGTLSNVVKVGSIEDAVTASAVGTYSTSSAGTAKTITVVYTLAGADKDNYIKPVDKVYTDGVITTKPIVVKAVASDKLYDGNKNANVLLSSLNIFSVDDVKYPYTLAEFDTKDVGNNKTVTVTGISLAGVDAGNYSLTSTTVTTTANITGSTIPFAVPNAFSPNGDGKNDKFKIIFNNTTGVTLSLQIYNRNGILMFSTNRISEGWDGRYKDIMQDMGIYFVKYRIEIAGGMTYEDTPRLYLFK